MASITDEWGYTEQLIQDTAEYRQYYQAPVNAMKEGLEILNSDACKTKSGWNIDARSEDGHDLIYSIKNARGKVMLFEGTMPFSSEMVFHEVYHNTHESPKWNPGGVSEFRVVLNVGVQCNVSYMYSPDLLGGLVKSREYCDSRCWRKLGKSYYCSQRSVECPQVPHRKDRIRAESILNTLHIEPLGENECKVAWLIQTDIKGMLPKAVVDRVSHAWLLNHMKLLREYILSKKDASANNL